MSLLSHPTTFITRPLPLPLPPQRAPLRPPALCSHPRPSTPRPPPPPRTTRRAPRPPPSDPRHDRWAPENLGFLHVATITGPHGVRGLAKARAEGDFPHLRLASIPKSSKPKQQPQHSLRYILLPGRRYPRPVAIHSGRPASQKDTWILAIDGINSREHVASLRGARIYVKDTDRPDLAPGEFMVGDLVGTTVRLVAHHRPVGVVETVLTKQELCHAAGSGAAGAAVASDLLEVALFHLDESHHTAYCHQNDADLRFKGEIPDKAKRVLVPFVEKVVPIVDLQLATITIDPPPGLLDIAVVNRKEKPRPPRGLLMPARG